METKLNSIADTIPMIVGSGPTAALLFFVPLWGPQITLWGLLTKRSRHMPEPIRYSISDAMILVAILAIASALSASQGMGHDRSVFLLCASNLLAALMWYKCIQFMSNNRISNSLTRVITQVFVYPSAVLSISYFAISAMMLFSGTIDTINSKAKSPPDVFLLAVVGMLLGSLCWIWLTRKVYSWIVTSRTQPNAG